MASAAPQLCDPVIPLAMEIIIAAKEAIPPDAKTVPVVGRDLTPIGDT